MKNAITIGKWFLVLPGKCLNLEFHTPWTVVQNFGDC